jgi:spermidine synthase
MKRIDHILSYFYPVTVELTHSPINPMLEVILHGGKYSLNSENTNYSYGSLYSVFEKVFRNLNLNWSDINNVLILGFGAGGVAKIISKYRKDCIIDGVEIDSRVIELGEKYFNLNSLKNVTVHCTGALQFLKNSEKRFDLVVIDVYLDKDVPEEIETEQFLQLVINALNAGGLVIFNKFINSKTSRNQLAGLRELYEKTFGNVQILTVMNRGKIFIARKQTEKY